MKVLLTIIPLLFMDHAQCAKILAVFPMAARSHYILGNALLLGLAERGHDVTMISSFSEDNPPQQGSYRDIVLEGFAEEHSRLMKQLNMFERNKGKMFGSLFSFLDIFVNITEKVFNHPNVQQLLNSDESFDLVVVEHFMNEAHKVFAYHYNAPLVVFSTLGANSWINYLVANPTPISYISDGMLGYSSKMTFCERLINSFVYTFQKSLRDFYILPKQKELVKKYFPTAPDLESIMYNTSLILLNSHPSTNQAVPSVPSMIEIGGFHVKPPKKLPEDLQTFLDNAENGVIYLSFGSNLKSAQLPLEKRQAFLEAFSKLKQKVLWKWEEDELPGQPDNVYLAKWVPQQDLLAHPNVKLFITHSGLLSTIETIYHGVPVLTIPIGGDQKLNAQQMVDYGIALKLNFEEISEPVLSESINEVLNNPKYKANAQSRSRFFHDRQVKPMDLAAYWIEYVLRHGTSHLRVAGLDLPWYQYHVLDVITVVALSILIASYIIYKFILIMISFTRNHTAKDKVKKS